MPFFLISGHLFLGFPQPRCSDVEAVGDVTAVPHDYTENVPSSSGYTNGAMGVSSHEDHHAGRVGKTNKKSTDNNKMIKISDKLIGVFMVDKPTPTDWRKLLAFSREWDNIRPHFFKRCQERADGEQNPEMKHNLLRLGRKLKEVLRMLVYFLIYRKHMVLYLINEFSIYDNRS